MYINIGAALYVYGDVDYVNYGGQFLIQDAFADEPYLEVIIPPDDSMWLTYGWADTAEWKVYRVPVTRLKVHGVELVPVDYDPATWGEDASVHSPWYASDTSLVYRVSKADYLNCRTVDEFERALCSPCPIERGWCYLALGEYFGWGSFDKHPLTLGISDMRRRYGAEVIVDSELCLEAGELR